MQSTLGSTDREELIDRLNDVSIGEAYDLLEYLGGNQLDVTQLISYTNADINRRLDYIERQEKY